CVNVIAAHASRVTGVKVSMLDARLEVEMRRRLPDGVRMYTGDDFNFAELMLGDELGHSDGLLGIFDGIAPAASAALQALDAGDAARYEALLAPTVPLSRHVFRAPTYHYKAGLVFLAFLNGRQRHFRMLGGLESARSIVHLAELFRLADRAGLLEDVELAASRMRPVLALVGGPAPDRDLARAREMVAEGVAATLEHAAACSVRLAVEPLHPMFAGDRSVIVTLAQALDLAERFPAERCGVIVDAYHVWWDPEVEAQIARAAGRILGYHVSDWLVPTPDLLLGRGMMGDGVIELRRLRYAVEAAGYTGPIEVEIFNQALWDMPCDDVLQLMRTRYLDYV